MLSRHKTSMALLFFIADLCIFFTQAMDQPQEVSAASAPQPHAIVERCLSDIQTNIQKNCRAIKKREIEDVDMLHYSTTLTNGNWVTASKNKRPGTYLVFYTIKKSDQGCDNFCTPVYGENAFRVFRQLELLYKRT